MMPGGHLVTAVVLSGTAYATTGSAEASAGAFVGGFLIDVDHYLDYLIFEKQWRRPSPSSFLSYYFTLSPKKLVLPLHSIELMTVLLGVILVHPWPLLVGYWVGAAMHMTFDVLVNGECALRRAFLFYFFAYRASQHFATKHLIAEVVVPPHVGKQPLLEFFKWRSASVTLAADERNTDNSF